MFQNICKCCRFALIVVVLCLIAFITPSGFAQTVIRVDGRGMTTSCV